jgi:hypothetical protein
MRNRRIKKQKDTNIFTLSKQISTTVLECTECGDLTECSSDAGSVICAKCVILSIPLESVKAVKKPNTIKLPKLNKNGKPRAKRGTGIKYQPTGFPRGWHFKKEYVHTDGRVFRRGKLVTN